MNTQVTKQKVNFIGIHYLDLIAKMISQGGRISNLIVDQTDESINVSFNVEFNENMTIIKEKLVYENNMLMLWKVTTTEGERIIFSREQLNLYLNS
ncbi:hypothetical protein [Heyndrickxia oleronia]|uniref:Uncharacterized protein n=1 Tax=Heyndrickxia oleronia TaxID=38875 RepID=A0AAW6SSV4_9BACI|nr:hypothetical protein [Heyndrickxia oleronia]MDH5160388.1 hypothetical protein [Heyndrickxia oleronia]